VTDYAKNGAAVGGGASLSDATPAALGTAAAGVSTDASRADHVHKKPAAADISDATAAGRALLTAADAAAQRTAIGVRYIAPQTPAVGPFSATAYLSAGNGAVEPSITQGKSLAATFWKRAGAGGVEQIIASRLDASPARGWALGILTSGNFYFYLHGPGALTLGSFDALAAGIHTIALTVHSTGATSYEVRYSIDGGAVSAATYAGATPIVPADATTSLYLGRQANATTRPLTSADLYEVTATSTEVSDADLALLSAAASPHPAVTSGTVTYNLLSYRDVWPGHATATTGAGSQTWEMTIAGGLTRWNH